MVECETPAPFPSFIVRPHPEHTNDALLGEDFVNKPMLNVDTPRIRACQITHELLVGRRMTFPSNFVFQG